MLAIGMNILATADKLLRINERITILANADNLVSSDPHTPITLPALPTIYSPLDPNAPVGETVNLDLTGLMSDVLELYNNIEPIYNLIVPEHHLSTLTDGYMGTGIEINNKLSSDKVKPSLSNMNRYMLNEITKAIFKIEEQLKPLYQINYLVGDVIDSNIIAPNLRHHVDIIKSSVVYVNNIDKQHALDVVDKLLELQAKGK